MDRALEDLCVCYARSGETEALGEVFDRTAPALLRTALHLAPDPASAEDLVQATFLTALQKASAFDPARRLMPWLHGILVRCAAKQREAHGRRGTPAPAGPAPDPVRAAEESELREQVRAHLGNLPVPSRAAVALRLLHGLEPAEIAEVLGLAPGTVRVRLHRGLERLRGLLPRGLALGAGVAWLSAGSARGLAAVRQQVLAAAVPAVPLAALGGALAVKKTLTLLAACVVLLLGVAIATDGFRPAAPPEPAAPSPARGALAGDPLSESRTTEERPPDRSAVEGREDAGETLPPTGTLVVRVVSLPGREAVAGALVQVTPLDGRDPRFSTRYGSTGAAGSARFELAEGGHRVRLTVRSQEEVDVEVAAGAETRKELVLDGCYSVAGEVVDARGGPVPFAELWLDARQHGFSHERLPKATRVGKADAFGRFRVAGLSSDLRLGLGARTPGHAPSHVHLLHAAPGDEVAVTLRLRGPAGELRGRVLGAGDEPVDGALVTVLTEHDLIHTEQGTRHGAAGRTTTTDTGGGFGFDDLPAGTVGVHVHAPGHAPFTRHCRLEAGATEEVVWRLAPGVLVHGRVTGQGGRPVAGARVSCLGLGPHESATTTTGPEGRYSFAAAPARWMELRVRAAGHERAEAVLTAGPGDTVAHDVELRPVAPVHGVLVDAAGHPLAGLMLSAPATRRWPVTDEEGRFELPTERGTTGPVRVHTRKPQATLPFTCGPFSPGDRPRIEVPDRCLPRGALHGRVLDAEGRPLGGAWVSVRTTGGLHVESLQADGEGRFVLRPLPAGSYEIEPAHWGGDRVPAAFGPFEVAPAEDADVGDLRLPDPGVLELRYHAVDGGPVRDAHAWVHGEGYDQTTVKLVEGADVATRRLPPGTHELLFLADDTEWVRRPFAIRAGETTRIDLELRRAVRRYVAFPVPVPDWGDPEHVDYALRRATGGLVDRNRIDPTDLGMRGLPHRFMPALLPGAYVLDLETDTGRRYRGTFRVDSLRPSHEPILIGVREVR